jgi:hypothetical protein
MAATKKKPQAPQRPDNTSLRIPEHDLKRAEQIRDRRNEASPGAKYSRQSVLLAAIQIGLTEMER